MGEAYVCLSPAWNIKIEELAKLTAKRTMALSWLQPTYFFSATGDAQHRDGKRTENGDGFVFVW